MIARDPAVEVLRNSAHGLQISLDKNVIVARLFKALADSADIAGLYRLGFVDKAQGVITGWHSASSFDGAPFSGAKQNALVELNSDNPLARAAAEGRPINEDNIDAKRLIVPLTCGGKTLAVLEVTTESRHAPDHLKTRTIEALCNQAAIALKNAEAIKSARKQARKLSSLYEVSGQLHSKRVPERIIALVADYAKKLPQSEKVVTWLIDGDSRLDMKSMVVRGCRRELPEKAWRADLFKLARLVLRQKKPALIRRYKLPAKIAGHPPPTVFVLGIPLMSKDRVNGVLIAMTSHPLHYGKDDIEALSILGQMAGRAIENASLYQHTKKLAAFEERYRIAMDLHDGLAQALFSIALNLEVCQRLIAKDPADVKNRLAGLQDLTLETLKDTRKYILGLQPDGAMGDALASIVKDYVRKFNHSNGIKVRSSVKGRAISELPIAVKQNLYRILQEALGNVVKHSKATEAKVNLTFADQNIELLVEDNGIGFPGAGPDAGKASPAGMGLMNMRKRADMIGGTLVLDSLPGQGTKVLVKVSVDGEPHDN